MEKQPKEKNDLMDNFLSGIMKEISKAEAILFREVTPTGNSGHVVCGKEFIGKNARVIITEEKNPEGFVEFKKVKKEEGKK